MLRKRTNSLALFALLIVAAACSSPTGGEQFIRGPRHSYEFKIEVEDTLSLYDLNFYTRLDGDFSKAQKLVVQWISPQDKYYREQVWMPLSRTVVQPYREGMHFPCTGQWTLKIRPINPPRGLRGMGLSWKIVNGTRQTS